MRKILLSGSWKQNGSMQFAKTFPKTLTKMQYNPKKIDITLAPSALHMETVKPQLEGSNIMLAA